MISGIPWEEWKESDLADVLEIERARARRHEDEERKTARMMAFLVTLWTGKETKTDDLMTGGKQEDQTPEEMAKRAAILAAYHSGAKREAGETRGGSV